MLRYIRLTLLPVLLGTVVLGLAATLAMAQDEGWSQPVLIFEGPGQVTWPAIAADVYGQVHGFWIFVPDASTGIDGRQLYYARIDRSDLQPLDIYISSERLASLQVASNKSQIGLLWDGTVYSSAQASSPLSARAWSMPEVLAAAYPTSSLAVGPDGALWVIYGDVDAKSIFVRRYDDATGWGSPFFVANISSSNAAPDAPKLGFSSDNVLHATWVEFQLPNGWPPNGVYYSRSTDGGQNWSAPIAIAEGGYNQPNVIGGAGQDVYLSWVGIAGVGGKYLRQSSDKGVTWGGITQLLPPGSGGSEGPPNMVMDSTGKLYVSFSNGNCVFFMALEANGWTDPDCISRNIPSSHTEQPVMAIGLGNRLHLMWWASDRQLWYMTRKLSVPGDEPLPTPTVAIPTPIPPTATPTLVPTPTHIPDYGAPMDPALTAQVGTWSVLAGIIPVILLLGLVLLRRFFQK